MPGMAEERELAAVGESEAQPVQRRVRRKAASGASGTNEASGRVMGRRCGARGWGTRELREQGGAMTRANERVVATMGGCNLQEIWVQKHRKLAKLWPESRSLWQSDWTGSIAQK